MMYTIGLRDRLQVQPPPCRGWKCFILVVSLYRYPSQAPISFSREAHLYKCQLQRLVMA